MSDRLDYYFKQRVTEAELDLGFTYLEQADRDIIANLGIMGVFKNAVVTQHSPSPNMTVDVGDNTGESVAYDDEGQKVSWPTTENVDVSQDSNSVSTAVASPGNSKIVSVFVEFDRALSDPRIDGNNLTVYFQRQESFQFVVVQGAEAVSPTAPALQAGAVLLADITLTFGQTTVVNGDISTDRAQYPFETTGGTYQIKEKTIAAAFQAVMDSINATSSGSFNASQINYAGGGAWVDATTNPAATVEAQLDKIVSDLTATAGSARVGAAAYTSSPSAFSNLSSGSIQSQLRQLADGLAGSVLAANISYAGGGALSAGTVEATLDDIGTRGLFTDVARTVTAALGFDNITATSTNKYKLASRSLVRQYGNIWDLTVGGGGWLSTTNHGVPNENTLNSSDPIIMSLDDLPNGAVITDIKVWCKGAGGHGSLPTIKPKFQLASLVVSTNTWAAEAGPFTDASGSTGAYQTLHTIDSGAISVTLDRTTKRYQLEFFGENNPNAVVGLEVYGVEVTMTVTSQDDAAG